MRYLWVAIAVGLLSSCASITGSKLQPVSVQTIHNGQPIDGANCSLTNDRGSWFVKTPGSTTIQKSGQNLSITCTKDGVPSGISTVTSSVNGAFMANILTGGVVGMIVDGATGAGVEYPTGITVQMGVVSNASQATPSNNQRYTQSNQAAEKINDVYKVPYLDDIGRAGYRKFLTRGNNRAFAVSETGGWGSAWEWKNTADAVSFALEKCLGRSTTPCQIYAVNNEVVMATADNSVETSAAGITFVKSQSAQSTQSKSKPPPNSKKVDIQTLKDLKVLLDSGAITQQEYDSKKAAILERL